MAQRTRQRAPRQPTRAHTRTVSELVVDVAPGAALPVIGQTLLTVSDMTGIRYGLHVKQLVALEWYGDHLLVTVRGHNDVLSEPTD